MTEPEEVEGDGMRERAVRGALGAPGLSEGRDSILSDAAATEGPGHGSA